MTGSKVINDNTPESPEDMQIEKNSEHVEHNEASSMPSLQDEEKVIKKKYGGLVPRKLPLISKDHERAFFDSADWALGKQGAPIGSKPKGPLEALRPKLQPTQQQVRSRRSAYSQAAEGEASSGGFINADE